ncbi:type II secretory system protein [Candidatus Scalindua japonica]|uniref:Type II secretory system protein n=1 Tax=Candidatus Scalindua japonica TaxID=1284222 RepID=A0A286TYX0_9BACT|nr:secretin and TonB N-terminal domain-containing protein [Candidatus Scalindua japonica]GAX61077.1 type II secretory system protein [Candidatus Scalindua japonica]
MKNIILAMIIVSIIAGCATTKEELKKMPVSQLVPEKRGNLSTLDELPVTQMLEEVKEREKLFSLSVKDMALKDVLYVLSEELPEYNVIVDPDASGKITASFKNLPLDKTLEILLRPLGLEYTIEDNILRVSQPRMLTRTFEFIYSTSTRKSKSSVLAVTGAGGEENDSASYGYIETEESVDVWGELESGIRSLMSSDTGKLLINKRVGYIRVTDYRPNMNEIEEYINIFKSSVKTQIHIRAKLLEVTLKAGNEFGINWAATLQSIGPFSGKTNPLNIVQSFAPRLGQTTTPTGESRPGDVAELFQIGKSDGDFNYLLTALKSQGDITVLSAPEVSILNGQKAILSSVTQDVYFETQQSAGGAGGVITTTMAKPFNFGVYLDVTPHVDSNGMITMEVHPSVSSFIALRTSGTAARPAIDTRETETVVTIKNGETILIAGLMKNDVKENQSKTPVLGDIPVAGKAFRRETRSNIKTELVILITPTIVGPRAKDFGSIRSKYSMVKKPFSR